MALKLCEIDHHMCTTIPQSYSTIRQVWRELRSRNHFLGRDLELFYISCVTKNQKSTRFWGLLATSTGCISELRWTFEANLVVFNTRNIISSRLAQECNGLSNLKSFKMLRYEKLTKCPQSVHQLSAPTL